MSFYSQNVFNNNKFTRYGGYPGSDLSDGLSFFDDSSQCKHAFLLPVLVSKEKMFIDLVAFSCARQ